MQSTTAVTGTILDLLLAPPSYLVGEGMPVRGEHNAVIDVFSHALQKCKQLFLNVLIAA